MVEFDLESTKWSIFSTSVHMFSQNHYHAVSMRDIASETGIKVSSIYNHFRSKEDLLEKMFEYCEYKLMQLIPDMEQILNEVKTSELTDLFRRTLILHNFLTDDLLNKIVVIASSLMRSNDKADKFLKHCLLEKQETLMRMLIDELIVQKRIELLDIDSFITIHNNFCYGAILRSRTFPVDFEYWDKGLNMLYCSIKHQEQ